MKVNWKAYALTVLCLFVSSSFSMLGGTIAKYKAEADMQATANVAKWDVTRTAALPTATDGYVKLRSGSTSMKSTNQLKFKNGSQVRATVVAATPGISDSWGSITSASNITVSHDPALGDIAIDGENAYYLTIGTNVSADSCAKVTLNWTINQVD